SGVTAPTPDVVHVDLDQPLASFAAVLADPAFGIVPREAVEAPTPSFGQQPAGSGAFRLASRGATVLRLVRATGSSAYLDGIDLHLGDPAATYQDFKAGRLDFSLVPPARVEEAAERYGRSGF